MAVVPSLRQVVVTLEPCVQVSTDQDPVRVVSQGCAVALLAKA